jgi:hypothetical protein
MISERYQIYQILGFNIVCLKKKTIEKVEGGII